VAAQGVADEIVASGGRAAVHLADVGTPEGAAGLIEAAVAAFGRLDILVSNTSVRITKPLGETSDDDWREVQASTLDAAFLCARAALPHLAAGGRGTIVNIGGVSGHAGVRDRSAVAAAKAGLAGLTGALAVELAPQGITVNCIAPGHLERSTTPGHISRHFVEKPIPLGRGGTAEEVAALVRFLCGPNGRYITGETIHVNGAWYVSIG
jgi:3-oxoacyl-[acyl-carrier protein] reductase